MGDYLDGVLVTVLAQVIGNLLNAILGSVQIDHIETRGHPLEKLIGIDDTSIDEDDGVLVFR
ncbi:hypothetical protein D3C85_519040 [compost metagenome]